MYHVETEDFGDIIFQVARQKLDRCFRAHWHSAIYCYIVI